MTGVPYVTCMAKEIFTGISVSKYFGLENMHDLIMVSGNTDDIEAMLKYDVLSSLERITKEINVSIEWKESGSFSFL